MSKRANKRGIKVLHINSEDGWGGGEQQIAYLIDESRKHKVESHVACKVNSKFELYCDENNIPSLSTSIRNSLDIKSVKAIADYIVTNRIDIIHVHSSTSHTIAYLVQLFGIKTPIFVSRRIARPLKNNYFTYRKYNSSRIKEVASISKLVKNEVDKVVADQNKSHLIYDGIDLGRFENSVRSDLRAELGFEKSTQLVGNIATLTPQKNYRTFINAAELLLEKHKSGPVKFLIIGSGPEDSILRSIVKERSLEDDIHFLGFRTDIPSILPQLDVFFFPSVNEGLGTSILDAFCCKVPVVAGDSGGIPELVQHGVSGLLSDPMDASSFASQINELLSSYSLRETLTKNAKASLQHFSKGHMAEQYVELYKNLISKDC